MTTTNLLDEVTEKVEGEKRLSPQEGLALLELKNPEEIERVRALADLARRRTVGDVVHFASTLYTHPTNLCELNCQFCSFYAKPGWDKAWFLTPAQIEEKVRAHHPKGLNEIHIVGGLWRECTLDYYEETFQRIKSVDPGLFIKALTPVEYDFLAKLHGISIEEVVSKMVSWGLGTLTGGGAEILVEHLRKKLAPGKISCEEFLAVHKLFHRLGRPTGITMLFDHIEENQDIIAHLLWVRSIQDETGGFRAFIPLKFGEEDNALGKRKSRLHKKHIPLVYAVCRLMLDNIPHLKVLWNYLGVDQALELLRWGGNDLSSTQTEEKIIHMAGGSKVRMDVSTMSGLITQAGRTPRLAHTGEVFSWSPSYALG